MRSFIVLGSEHVFDEGGRAKPGERTPTAIGICHTPPIAFAPWDSDG